MKILSRHGQKVLDAPLDANNAYYSSFNSPNHDTPQKHITLEVFTAARGTQYIVSLSNADIEQLDTILRGI